MQVNRTCNTNSAQSSVDNNTINNSEEFAPKQLWKNMIINSLAMRLLSSGLIWIEFESHSTLCPTNNCEYELEDGQLAPFLSGSYLFTGLLMEVEEEEGARIQGNG
ncbi:MAG: hypothetical protein P0116_16020 [Candidatus Nitrosocosmicus sp.]|nr:hypothetical protein [Candidatus Nitrosocosmicus sp.]